MPLCFICSISLPSINALHLHLRITHKYDDGSVHRCVAAFCLKDFSNWRKCRDHLQKVHNFVANAPKEKAVLALAPSDIEINVPLLEVAISESSTANSCDILDEANIPVKAPSEKNISVHDLLVGHAFSVVTKWYADPKLPRSVVQNVVEDTSDLVMSTVNVLGVAVCNKLTDLNVDPNLIETVRKTIFQNITSPFQGLETEYMRLKHLERDGFYTPPVNFIIGSGLHSALDRENRDIVLTNEACHGKHIQLRVVLKKFLSLPGVLDVVLESIQNKHTNVVKNFVDGSFWKRQMLKFKDKIVVPLFGYFDEFDKDIGPHSHKLGAVYVSIASLPPEYRGAVENIFLCSLFLNEDKKDFGASVFNKFIDELKFLSETGISVNRGNKCLTIYFALGLLVGDNLGLHFMLGLVESFSAIFACRFCMVPKSIMRGQSKVENRMLRSRESYRDAVLRNDVSQTGIKQECIFHELEYFHATENPFVDLFHDCYEGVFKDTMRHILRNLMFHYENGRKVQKYFTLQTLNMRLLTFHYSPNMSNHVGQFSADFLETGLKLTGHEMLNLLRILSIVVGDLVPPNDEIWEFYLLTRRINDLITSRALQVGSEVYLKSLIQEHNEEYVRLFGEHLKPKFHHLLHYPHVLKESGPLVFLSVDRFEAKHQPAKEYAKASKSRRNIAHSIAVKDQLEVAERVFRKRGLGRKLKIGPRIAQTTFVLPKNFEMSVPCSFVILNGTIYKKEVCVVIDIDNISSLPRFGLVEEVFVNDVEEVCLVCGILLIKCFSKHFSAYEVEKANKLFPVLQRNLVDPLPVYFNVAANNVNYVTLHHGL